MSEVIRWMIIAVIAVVVLSWSFMAWRKRQRLGRPSHAEDSDHIDSFWQKHPMLLSLIALSLAGLAQYALRINQPEFAALGYLFAVILFISALRQFVPATMMDETFTPTAEPKTKPPQPKPSPTLPKSAFLKTWRYYILTSILKGHQPNIPSSATIETAPEAESIAANKSTDIIELGLSPSSSTPNIGIALERISINSSAEVSVEKLIVEPAAIRVWTGFGRPQGLGVTPNGNVLVLDSARQRVYCLNSLGIVIRVWALPEMPKLQDYSIAFSPDGQKLYLADPAHGQVYSFTFSEDRL